MTAQTQTPWMEWFVQIQSLEIRLMEHEINETHRQLDSQTGGQPDRQAGGKPDRQAGRQVDSQAGRQTYIGRKTDKNRQKRELLYVMACSIEVCQNQLQDLKKIIHVISDRQTDRQNTHILKHDNWWKID